MPQKYICKRPQKNKINKLGDFLNEWGGFFNEWDFYMVFTWFALLFELIIEKTLSLRLNSKSKK